MSDSATTLDDVLQQTADAHPAPNEQAAQIVADVMSAGSATPLGAPTAGTLDRKGTPFDPTKNDGTLTARGTWRIRRNSARSAALGGEGSTAGQSTQPHADAPPLGGVEPITIDTRAVAESWLTGAFTFLPMILGEDWKPSDDERGNLTDALERYMIAAGIDADLPPGWALLLAVGVYALPRCLLASTKERVGAIAGRIKSLGKKPLEKAA